MKKLLIRTVCLSLAFVVTIGAVSIAATKQSNLVASLCEITLVQQENSCCTKKKVEKTIPVKTKLGKKHHLTPPKQCYKQPDPTVEKPSSIKIPVLLPIERQVAFQGNMVLPMDALAIVSTTSSSHLLTPSY